MSTIIKPKRATQEEIAASTKVLSKDEILLSIPNEGDHSGKLKLYRGDGITPANELPVGIDGELGDDLKISAFEESTAEENQELEAGSSLSRLFGSIKRRFAQVQNETSNKVNSNGDISNTVIGSVDTITAEFPEPAAGESTKTYLGKVKKFIADFNSFKNGIITLGRLANNADTTVEGFALDARMGKMLGDRVAQLNSDLGEVSSNFNSKFRNIGNIDLNDIITTTFGYVSSCTNAPPVGNGYFLCISSGGMCWQQYIAYQTGAVYERQLLSDGKTWKAWKKRPSNDDFATGVAWCSYPAADTWYVVDVTYGKTLNSIPNVFLQVREEGRVIHTNVYNITTTGCTIKYKSNVNGNSNMQWMAIAV